MELSLEDITGETDNTADELQQLTDEALNLHFVISGLVTASSYFRFIKSVDVSGYASLCCDITETICGAIIAYYGVKNLSKSIKNGGSVVMTVDGVSSVAICTSSTLTNQTLSKSLGKFATALSVVTPYIVIGAAAQAWMVFGYALKKWHSAQRKCDPEELLKDRIKKYNELALQLQNPNVENRKKLITQQNTYFLQIQAIASNANSTSHNTIKALLPAGMPKINFTNTPEQKKLYVQLIDYQRQEAMQCGYEAATTGLAALGLTALTLGSVLTVGALPLILASVLVGVSAIMKSRQVFENYVTKKATSVVMPELRKRYANQYSKEALRVISSINSISMDQELRVKAKLLYESRATHIKKTYGSLYANLTTSNRTKQIERNFYISLFQQPAENYKRILNSMDSLIDKEILKTLTQLDDTGVDSLTEKSRTTILENSCRSQYSFFKNAFVPKQSEALQTQIPVLDTLALV